MTLCRLGSVAGPDRDRLASIMRARGFSSEAGAGSRKENARRQGSCQGRIYAAGVVRGPADFASLAQAGVHGVLVASALHEGQLTGADLAAAAPI
jgi:phosphoribosylformimino-5-aminoimidazole carboxamide ribotide isomerase